jgi:transposase
VAEERKTDSLAAYYQAFTDEQRDGLQAVAMDMWEPYIIATRDGLPDGGEKIVFDRFHIMREMTQAVDTVRKQEHRSFLRTGEDSPLTGTKYLCSDALGRSKRRCGHSGRSGRVLPSGASFRSGTAGRSDHDSTR